MARSDHRLPEGCAILLHIIARGKNARSPEAELVARYEKRLTWPLRLTELPETGGRIPEPQTPCKTVLLDERGQDLPSEKLAAILERWRDDGMRECRFVIGAADGHADDDRHAADLLLAFGQATWPHLLARACQSHGSRRSAARRPSSRRRSPSCPCRHFRFRYPSCW